MEFISNVTILKNYGYGFFFFIRIEECTHNFERFYFESL
jgi:hypothetical protein